MTQYGKRSKHILAFYLEIYVVCSITPVLDVFLFQSVPNQVYVAEM